MSNLPVIDDQWVLGLRGPRNQLDPLRPYTYLFEPEPSRQRKIEDVATIFITNRECPFRCLMCDLWINTTPDRVPDGAVATQIDWALDQMPFAPQVKLYNAGNFFDSQAIPRADWARIAQRLSDRKTVIVECHPKLLNDGCLEFAKSLNPALEVAMGLETIDPNVLPRLNKRMTLHDFERATRFLLGHGINVRAFILLKTPFQNEQQGVDWAKASLDYAFDIGVECCAVIPTRPGNGAMDALARSGHFSPPTLTSLETVMAHGLSQRRGRVFVDLWDIKKTAQHQPAGPQRIQRLAQMNLRQQLLPPVHGQGAAGPCQDRRTQKL